LILTLCGRIFFKTALVSLLSSVSLIFTFIFRTLNYWSGWMEWNGRNVSFPTIRHWLFKSLQFEITLLLGPPNEIWFIQHFPCCLFFYEPEDLTFGSWERRPCLFYFSLFDSKKMIIRQMF
jgi:hypothetical protein